MAVATVVRGGQVGAKLLDPAGRNARQLWATPRSTPRSRPTPSISWRVSGRRHASLRRRRATTSRSRSSSRPFRRRRRSSSSAPSTSRSRSPASPRRSASTSSSPMPAPSWRRRERFPDADRIIQGWPDETLAAGRDPAQHLRRHPLPRPEVRRTGARRHARARPPPTSGPSAAATRTRTAAAVSPRPG